MADMLKVPLTPEEFVVSILLDPNIYATDTNGWFHVGVVSCDLCTGPAEYFHPEGGARCHTCPRPSK